LYREQFQFFEQPFSREQVYVKSEKIATWEKGRDEGIRI